MGIVAHIFGAIDAGSNAIRYVIAHREHGKLVRLEADRMPVRLGHGAFTCGELDGATIDAAVQAFRHFRERFTHFGVTAYRAVATSAVRDAHNRDVLVHRVYQEAGLDLDVIDGTEEARLVRKAVVTAFMPAAPPPCILDLGGGSLEVNFLTPGSGWRAVSLPIGTVRLVESFGIREQVSDSEAAMVRRYAHTLVSGLRHGQAIPIAAITGGNAEALARICGADMQSAAPAFELQELERSLPSLLATTLDERCARFGVRRDRAEVLAVAALVFATVGRQLGIGKFVAPGVGVREALLLELSELALDPDSASTNAADKALLTAGRALAAKVDHDVTHGEQVRRLAQLLFAQLRDIHNLPPRLGTWLELAALLHDIGEVIHPRGHQKHSEYMIRWARLPGLDAEGREVVALVARCHRKPASECKKIIGDSQLGKEQRMWVRRLAALLRIADSLDSHHRRRVVDLLAHRAGDAIVLDLVMRDGPVRDDGQWLAKADLFRDEFGLALRCTFARPGTGPHSIVELAQAPAT